MGRIRRTSKTIAQAEARASGLKSKDKDFDLGNGLTAAAYEQKITTVRNKLNTYNNTLALADDQLNDFVAAEKDLGEFSSRILSAVKAKYGPDSSEVELAGGIRKSDRQPPKRKPPTPKP
jgi:hypothetical protein